MMWGAIKFYVNLQFEWSILYTTPWCLKSKETREAVYWLIYVGGFSVDNRAYSVKASIKYSRRHKTATVIDVKID